MNRHDINEKHNIWKEITTIKILTLLCLPSSLLGGHVLIFFYQKHKKIHYTTLENIDIQI